MSYHGFTLQATPKDTNNPCHDFIQKITLREIWFTPGHGYFNDGTPITPIKKCHDNITNDTMSWLAYIKYTQKNH